MNDYAKFRQKVHGCVVPLPIVYREDLSIDHAGLERYVGWVVENGVRNLCLTFTFSQLDSVTPEEIIEVTRTVVGAAGQEAVFIPCTGGGPLTGAIDSVRQMQKIGAPAAFVHLPEWCLQSVDTGDLYVNYIHGVASQTDMPILCVALPKSWTPTVPMLTIDRLEKLAEDENFCGLKDDIYQPDYRMSIARTFGQRLCTIGGGNRLHYVLFHHLPNQSEFAGLFDPKRALGFFELLDQNRVPDALDTLEQGKDAYLSLPGLHWMALNQVVFYAMGFAETYLIRPPLASATDAEAKAIIDNVRKYPEAYEQIVK